MAGPNKSDVNVYIVEGEIVSEPEVKTFDSGATKTRLRLAAKRRWKDKSTGLLREAATYLDVVGWSDVGQRMVSLKTGEAILVVGELRSWMQQKDDGTKKYGVEVEAQSVTRQLSNPADDNISFPSQQESADLFSGTKGATW